MFTHLFNFTIEIWKLFFIIINFADNPILHVRKLSRPVPLYGPVRKLIFLSKNKILKEGDKPRDKFHRSGSRHRGQIGNASRRLGERPRRDERSYVNDPKQRALAPGRISQAPHDTMYFECARVRES